ncbi:MAG: caspase family protein [Drouetiella hepatica Uher 2000/2452]|jgi:uncharacterized caspase-like protein|uniref:Caspase family protein n=1 Tax=Drouetiella hepatica Uher 2000/2452 TaxID=904376 RepID=A0A951QE71_9CYAN|nr:caspase family protein [Drouetiella hepatica Uher 2000/2452]
MAKVALLVGVSEYEPGLNSLPGAVRDIEAVQRVLRHPEMGSFDDVKMLSNPDPLAMQEAIEALFLDRAKNDLILLFFSGHGIKDESGMLYLATRITRKHPKGELVKATAVSASSIHDIMNGSRCKRQVVILDCCFSGAFAEGMKAKDDGVVDLQTQLGGEGRAVLTSSTSTQYSFEQQGSDLSVYTRYIVEGIETGAADTNNDGIVSIDELHDYARKKVQETAPAMKPKIYAVEEGFNIRLAAAAVGDPKLRYRREIERFASRGEISSIGRRVLGELRDKLKLLPEEVAAIEAETLEPYRKYQKNLQEYSQALSDATQRETQLSGYTRNELKRLQEVLGLRDEDVEPIESEISSRQDIKTTEGEQKQIAEWYAQALIYLRDGQWVEAIQLLGQINAQQTGYKDVSTKLHEAKRQQQIAELTAKVEESYASQTWVESIKHLEAILAIDPENQKVKTRLDDAKRQRQLATLYAQARNWHREQQWQRVIDVFREIRALDTSCPDPDNLQELARQRLREKERLNQEGRVAKLHNRGQLYMNAQEWQKAIEVFEELAQLNPNYRDTSALLAEAQQELNQGKQMLPFMGLIAAVWVIILFLANPLGDSVAGGIGGLLTGLAIAWTTQDEAADVMLQQLLKILMFGVAGAVVGSIVWLIIPNLDNSSIPTITIPIVKALISAGIGISALLLWKQLG